MMYKAEGNNIILGHFFEYFIIYFILNLNSCYCNANALLIRNTVILFFIIFLISLRRYTFLFIAPEIVLSRYILLLLNYILSYHQW